MLLLPDTRILKPYEKPSFEWTQRYGLDWQNAKVSLEGLVGYWLMNEGTGNAVADLGGNGNHGVFVNTPLWTADRILFEKDDNDGIDVTPPNASVFPSGSDPYTIVCKINITDRTNAVTVFDYDLYDPQWGFYNGVPWIYDGHDTLTGGTALSNGIDYQVAFVRDGTGANQTRVYVNGVLWYTGQHDESMNVPTTVRIGYDNNAGEGFDGHIYFTYIYNRAFSASEIALLYQEPSCQVWKPKTQIVVGWVSGGSPASGIPILRRRREYA